MITTPTTDACLPDMFSFANLHAHVSNLVIKIVELPTMQATCNVLFFFVMKYTKLRAEIFI